MKKEAREGFFFVAPLDGSGEHISAPLFVSK